VFGFAAGISALVRIGGFSNDIAVSLGSAIFAFIAAFAFVESLDLFVFAARNKAALDEPMGGRYSTLILASSILTFVTMLVAIFAVIHPVTATSAL
jgi:hypothetical protein